MSRGYFIAFEGPEGAGKSTQLRLLADGLRVAGYAVVTTREPGGTPIGERIRAVLLDRSALGMAPETEALLLNAARAQHVRDLILPALERGQIVLCDRYADSTLAYQGGGRGIRMHDLLALQLFSTGGVSPNVRVLLDLNVEEGLRRRHGDAGTANRLDDEDLAFHQSVREAYRELVAEQPDQWLVIDATQDRAAMTDDIRRAVLVRLSAAGFAGAAHVQAGIPE